jgi:hypothetical protein
VTTADPSVLPHAEVSLLGRRRPEISPSGSGRGQSWQPMGPFVTDTPGIRIGTGIIGFASGPISDIFDTVSALNPGFLEQFAERKAL